MTSYEGRRADRDTRARGADDGAMLNRLARRHRDHVCVMVGFNEAMARRIVGGSDFCLMPSRFEPCGLTQMQAQRYGSLPIAHATGGLADTIEDGETGFLFSQFSARSLLAACGRALTFSAIKPVFLSCVTPPCRASSAGPKRPSLTNSCIASSAASRSRGIRHPQA